jgi:hypothetical protein
VVGSAITADYLVRPQRARRAESGTVTRLIRASFRRELRACKRRMPAPPPATPSWLCRRLGECSFCNPIRSVGRRSAKNVVTRHTDAEGTQRVLAQIFPGFPSSVTTSGPLLPERRRRPARQLRRRPPLELLQPGQGPERRPRQRAVLPPPEPALRSGCLEDRGLAGRCFIISGTSPSAAADCFELHTWVQPMHPRGSDVECAGGSGDRPRYGARADHGHRVRPLRLDGDRNGIGCES